MEDASPSPEQISLMLTRESEAAVVAQWREIYPA